ncbi:hypothetical protein ACFLQR_04450, partial [Verrucomicrobiota bacterium]
VNTTRDYRNGHRRRVSKLEKRLAGMRKARDRNREQAEEEMIRLREKWARLLAQYSPTEKSDRYRFKGTESDIRRTVRKLFRARLDILATEAALEEARRQEAEAAAAGRNEDPE